MLAGLSDGVCGASLGGGLFGLLEDGRGVAYREWFQSRFSGGGAVVVLSTPRILNSSGTRLMGVVLGNGRQGRE